MGAAAAAVAAETELLPYRLSPILLQVRPTKFPHQINTIRASRHTASPRAIRAHKLATRRISSTRDQITTKGQISQRGRTNLGQTKPKGQFRPNAQTIKSPTSRGPISQTNSRTTEITSRGHKI